MFVKKGGFLMANLTLKGVFMGSSVKTSEYEGNKKTTLLIDVYQPESESTDKVVQVRSNEVDLLNSLSKNYSMGSIIECEVYVNAYRNQAYYNLQKIVG